VAVCGWLRLAAERDADGECRALAGAMLSNALLRQLVLGAEDE
jgi:hypothetical protein